MPTIKANLMTAAVEIDDVVSRLTALSEAFLKASHATLEPAPGEDSALDPIADWADCHRKPEPAPPAPFLDDLLRFLADFDRRSWGLKNRFDRLPSADDMPTLREILEDAQDEIRRAIMAAIWTAKGKPTPRSLIDYRYLDREPATITLDDATVFEVTPISQGRDARGREARTWRVSIRDDAAPNFSRVPAPAPK